MARVCCINLLVYRVNVDPVFLLCLRSFLGMTVHWICPVTLDRKAASLTCRRIKGRHTYDVLAKAMSKVHDEFGIDGTVVSTTTDNGSNFVRAFK